MIKKHLNHSTSKSELTNWPQFIELNQFPLCLRKTPIFLVFCTRKFNNGLEDLWLSIGARLGVGGHIRSTIKRLFWKLFVEHKSFLWCHWYPYFGLLVMSVLGLKTRVDQLFYVICGLHAMDYSDSPLVQHLLTSWAFLIHVLVHIFLSICGTRTRVRFTRMNQTMYNRAHD